MSQFDLSIIVPLLNERQNLPLLFEMLARQTGVRFEVILVDGGSTDGSRALIAASQATSSLALRLVDSSAGRARQLNLGARQAAADLLLFLHVDSCFPDPSALQQALQVYRQALGRQPGSLVGGHFQLEFQRTSAPYGFGYYFWEWKARLDRADCIHGDQGLLLSREIFQQVGPFNEAAVIAEENLLTEKLRRNGHWLLLPGLIRTSARRFESEGLAARQTLNALLMNFAAIGWNDYFERAVDVYRRQGETDTLSLAPYLALIDALLSERSPAERRQLWLATGDYVKRHAWQIPFALDVRRAYRRRLPVGEGALPLLAVHDRWFERLTANRFASGIAAGLTWIWFRWVRWRSSHGRSG